MLDRQALEKIEHDTLAPYAAFSDQSRGRDHPIPPCPMRTAFMRDRDRVIHSAAFRKLEHKTQVYVVHEGDYYRTRLTHTMEVAQIARSMARNLALNADLAEAIALAHDLGHTPFAHAGERALARLVAHRGGFEHNVQGLRVVETLENRYSAHPGLNLCYETREGIAKHQTSYDSARVERFDLSLSPPLEGQLADLADEIAYNHHDLDDALEMGLLTRADLAPLPWLDRLASELESADPQLAGPPHSGEAINPYLRSRLISLLIDRAVKDVLHQSQATLARSGVASIDDVRRHAHRLIGFSPDMETQHTQLKDFLMQRVYRHPQLLRMCDKVERFVEALFRLYQEKPELLPHEYQQRLREEELDQVLVDYISGMTDRSCMEAYRQAFLPEGGAVRYGYR